MRAYIKAIDPEKFDLDENQKYWATESEESFHGEVSDTRDSFIFKDHRLPEIELPLCDVEIEE